LKTAKFNECLDSGKYTAKVNAQLQEGQGFGVS
jgi:protein-disulfide isomerase